MTSRAVIVEPEVPHFEYGKRTFYLRQESPTTWSMACPVCEVRRALRFGAGFVVTVLPGATVDVTAVIRCPTASCGWAVKITAGLARDVET